MRRLTAAVAVVGALAVGAPAVASAQTDPAPATGVAPAGESSSATTPTTEFVGRAVASSSPYDDGPDRLVLFGLMAMALFVGLMVSGLAFDQVRRARER